MDISELTVKKLEDEDYTPEQLKNIYINLHRTKVELDHKLSRIPVDIENLRLRLQDMAMHPHKYFTKNNIYRQIVAVATQITVTKKRLQEIRKKEYEEYRARRERRNELQRRLNELSDVRADWDEQDAEYNRFEKMGVNFWDNDREKRKKQREQQQQMGHQLYRENSEVIITDNRNSRLKYHAKITAVGPKTVKVNGKNYFVPRDRYFVVFDDSTWTIVGLNKDSVTSDEQYYISGLTGKGD